MKYPLLLILFTGVFVTGQAGAVEYSDEQRLAGFQDHQRKNADFEKSRQVGADEIKKKRREWDEKIQNSMAEYKEKKSRQAEPLDESSPEYQQDRKARKDVLREQEERRQAFIRERDAQRARKKTNIKLTEEEELGLNAKVDRIDWHKRSTYNAKASRGAGVGGFSRPGSIGGGNQDFSTPSPPPDFTPPPPPPPAPEFFEPEIPPPPPMPEFDDSIPPPVFDEPEF